MHEAENCFKKITKQNMSVLSTKCPRKLALINKSKRDKKKSCNKSREKQTKI